MARGLRRHHADRRQPGAERAVVHERTRCGARERRRHRAALDVSPEARVALQLDGPRIGHHLLERAQGLAGLRGQLDRHAPAGRARVDHGAGARAEQLRRELREARRGQIRQLGPEPARASAFGQAAEPEDRQHQQTTPQRTERRAEHLRGRRRRVTAVAQRAREQMQRQLDAQQAGRAGAERADQGGQPELARKRGAEGVASSERAGVGQRQAEQPERGNPRARACAGPREPRDQHERQGIEPHGTPDRPPRQAS
jgi:hypothetical protein